MFHTNLLNILDGTDTRNVKTGQKTTSVFSWKYLGFQVLRMQIKFNEIDNNLSNDVESECVQNVCAVEFLHKTYKQGAVKSAV